MKTSYRSSNNEHVRKVSERIESVNKQDNPPVEYAFQFRPTHYVFGRVIFLPVNVLVIRMFRSRYGDILFVLDSLRQNPPFERCVRDAGENRAVV